MNAESFSHNPLPILLYITFKNNKQGLQELIDLSLAI